MQEMYMVPPAIYPWQEPITINRPISYRAGQIFCSNLHIYIHLLMFCSILQRNFLLGLLMKSVVSLMQLFQSVKSQKISPWHRFSKSVWKMQVVLWPLILKDFGCSYIFILISYFLYLFIRLFIIYLFYHFLGGKGFQKDEKICGIHVY